MKIAIFGSCVSRDTCEFIPDSTVLAYDARHSATSLETAHGTAGIDLGGLDSPFQKRMVITDLRGHGVIRLIKDAAELDVVLIDLTDERRGFWRFPDGTTMTNSLEIEACGAAAAVAEAGAELVEFGSEEHFAAWKSGFSTLVAELREAGLWEKTVLLDIEWAAAMDGAQHPQEGALSTVGRQWRKLQRGTREVQRALGRGEGVSRSFKRLRTIGPTEAEEFAARATKANADYVRYRETARAQVAQVIERRSAELRIAPDHKWGPQPFHYRDKDYRSIVDSIQTFVTRRRRAGADTAD